MKAHCERVFLILVVAVLVLGGFVWSGVAGSAWATAAPTDYTISGYINPTDSNLNSLYFIGTYTAYDGSTGYFFQVLNHFDAGVTTPFSFTTSYYGYAPTAYTILAIHDAPNFDGVTVGSNSILPGTSWDSLFGSQYSQATFNSLVSGSYVGYMLEQFYANNATILGTSMGNSLTLVNFSVASNGGVVYASTVPVPATLLLLGPGLVGLAALRRRIRK